MTFSKQAMDGTSVHPVLDMPNQCLLLGVDTKGRSYPKGGRGKARGGWGEGMQEQVRREGKMGRGRLGEDDPGLLCACVEIAQGITLLYPSEVVPILPKGPW